MVRFAISMFEVLSIWGCVVVASWGGNWMYAAFAIGLATVMVAWCEGRDGWGRS